MKVLHIGEYAQGGVATYISTLMHHPDEKDIEDFLICSKKNSEHAWPIPEDHVTYYNYHRSLFQILPAMVAIRKEIARIQPDVIYCHSTWAGLFGRLPLLFTKKSVCVLYNAHGWAFLRDTAEWKRKIYALVERVLLCKTDAVVNVSRYEQEAAKRYHLPIEKQHIIYSGISSRKRAVHDEPQLSPEAIHLLFVGRFDPQKGVDYLLEAFEKCSRMNIHLSLIGDNVVGGMQIRKENTDRVTFYGWIPHDQLGSYYATCDAVIMPSRWEAFGLVAVEAMKYGKPVIASNRGALPELVEHGKNGYMFDFNHQETLVDLLNHLDKEKLFQMGKKAEKDFQEKYTMGRMVGETIRLYKKSALT